MQHKFGGTGVALVTPFNENDEIDYSALTNLVLYNLKEGIDYFVVLGTTAESATLNLDEKQKVLETVIEANAGIKPVVLGIGGNDTKSVAKQFSDYNMDGVDSILSVSPYYNKPSQEGIYQHYKYLSQRTPRPLILYNVPSRTQSNIEFHTTLRLAKEFDNIIGIKEASGDLEQIGKIIRDAPSDFFIVSGDDTLTLPIIAIGGHGVISVVANSFPKEFRNMVNHALKSRFAEASEIHRNFLDIIGGLFAEGNPTGVKYALYTKGICSSKVRLPLMELTAKGKSKLDEAIQKLELLTV